MGLFVSPHRRIDCGKLLSLGSNKPGKQTFHGLKCHVEKCQKDILYTWKIGVVACGGRGLSGRKWITRQSFFDSLSSASRRWTRKTSSYRGGIGWRSRDRREFYFLSRYFRFRPWCNTRSFRVNFRAYNYLRTTGMRLRSQNHSSGFRLRNHFLSVSFRFRSIQDGARGRHGSWKVALFHWIFTAYKYANFALNAAILRFYVTRYFY